MKKFLALVLTLALALSLSVTAFAEDHTIDESVTLPTTKDTTVQFNVNPTYTITIPAEVVLKEQTNAGAVTYEQEATITASKGVRLLNDQTIQVTLSAGDGEEKFVLTTDQDATLDYTVTVNGEEIENGGTVATFGTSLEEQNSLLHFAAKDPTYAGEYSDKVTFTISIESEQDADTDNTESTEP